MIHLYLRSGAASDADEGLSVTAGQV